MLGCSASLRCDVCVCASPCTAQLLSLLSECMHPAVVSVDNPLEVSKQGVLGVLYESAHLHVCIAACLLLLSSLGREMIETYFSPPAFKLWKSTRYTKLRLF